MCRCLTDCQGEARRCALKTLSCIAEEGDSEARAGAIEPDRAK